jgi:spermidine synthase
MHTDFEEIDAAPTPLGDIVLRRRRDPRIGDVDIFEVKLGEEFLMSSLFHDSEVALADLCLAQLAARGHESPWDVLVGGLGLGYTAHAAIANNRVGSLQVIELFEPVIRWHQQGLVPLGKAISGDARCQLTQADFFARVIDADRGFDDAQPQRRYDAILVDIDHAPDRVLDTTSSPFYEPAGLIAARNHLKPGGVFGLWSDDPPHDGFLAMMNQVFEAAEGVAIAFANPYTGGESACSVYLGSA